VSGHGPFPLIRMGILVWMNCYKKIYTVDLYYRHLMMLAYDYHISLSFSALELCQSSLNLADSFNSNLQRANYHIKCPSELEKLG